MTEKLAYYVDRAGALGKLERTPQGGYRIPATMARTGVMGYPAWKLRRQGLEVPAKFKDHETVRIHLPAEVLQAAAQTAMDAPVTNEHPPKFVDPSNFKEFADGYSRDVTFDGEMLKGTLVIQDAQLLADIELNERREVSMGYMARTRFEEGVTDKGEKFHAVRTAVEYNHTAVVTAGRAGDQVCLALDSAEIPRETPMKIKVQGKELEGADVQAAVDTVEALLEAAVSREAALKAELVATKTELETAKSEDTFNAKLKAVNDAKDAEEKRKSQLEKCRKAYPEHAALKADDVAQAVLDALEATIKVEDEGVAELKGKVGVVKVKDTKAETKTEKAPKLSARARGLQANRGLFGKIKADSE